MATGAGYQGNGFFGSLFGPQQVGTSTTATQTSYPDWFSAAATANTLPFMQPQKNMIAGMNEDQMMAGNLARQGAANAYNGTDYASQIAGAGDGYTPAQVTGQDALDLANPFYQSVGRDTINTMRDERDNAGAAIGARNANLVAFGGSGAALERAQLERGFNDNAGKAVNSIMAQGYDRGADLASQNAQMRNQAGQFNSQQKLASLIGANSAANDTQNRQRSALQDLLGFGNQSQEQAQRQLDIPWTAMQRYMSLQPGAQTTSTPQMMNPLESLLGFLL